MALAAGLMWKYPLPNKSSGFRVSELAHGSGTPLRTEIPPELIEGTPKAITVPNLVPAPEQAPVFFVPIRLTRSFSPAEKLLLSQEPGGRVWHRE
ncbi:MAG: hypothetical protein NTW21_17740 [Verrucomicrobia bacterium]|nr:hypothetical protein [Verrucomicrobiota bacterium]